MLMPSITMVLTTRDMFLIIITMFTIADQVAADQLIIQHLHIIHRMIT